MDFGVSCDLKPGQNAIVRRVRDTNSELLRYLSDLGIVPQARIVVLDYSRFDDNQRIQVEGRSDGVVLGPRVTRQIFVDEE